MNLEHIRGIGGEHLIFGEKIIDLKKPFSGFKTYVDTKLIRRAFATHHVTMCKQAFAMTSGEQFINYASSTWGWACKCGEVQIDFYGCCGFEAMLDKANQHIKEGK